MLKIWVKIPNECGLVGNTCWAVGEDSEFLRYSLGAKGHNYSGLEKKNTSKIPHCIIIKPKKTSK